MPENIVKAQGYIKRNISVLYLAEVKKQSRSFLGAKAELKLLACQRKDQSWSAIPGEEMKETEEAINFENGALVLINLGDNRQIQGKVEPAASKLVNILQNFSRVVEKAKKEEDTIEQWKQSLTYQGHELRQRELEMEGRLEQLEQLQEEFDRLAQERQEFESNRAEVEALKAEFERKQLELEGAWEHLRGEKQQLNEQQGTILDEGVSRQIHEFLEQSAQREMPTEELKQQVHSSLDLVNRHQETLDFHWQQKEEKQAEAEQKQAEVNEQRERLNISRQGLQELQDSLSQAGEGFQEQQRNLEVKQRVLSVLGLQLQHQDQLHDHLSRLAVASDHVKLSQEIDLEALENMPLGELESKVEQLQQDLDRVVSFVNDQEEELMLELEDIETVRSKIATASEYDKLALDQELNETQDRYQMLDRTLMGQRRNLREREEVYGQHSRILRRRKGLIEESSEAQKIDLTPVLKELDSQRQDTQEELQHLEKEIEQMRQSIQQAQEMIDSQTQNQGQKQEELDNLEASWQEMQQSTAEIWAKVNLYEEMLHPLQDNVSNLRQQLEGLATLAEDINASSSEHLNAIAQMQEILKEIMA